MLAKNANNICKEKKTAIRTKSRLAESSAPAVRGRLLPVNSVSVRHGIYQWLTDACLPAKKKQNHTCTIHFPPSHSREQAIIISER